MSNKGSLIVISAPSGSGKTSLAARILEAIPNLKFSVSHTTRSMRAGERDGVDYFFVSESEFQEMICRGQFLEYAQVYGHWYGTSRDFVLSELKAGSDVLLDIDVQGALKVKNQMPEAELVFVLPPSFETLRERLLRRGLDEAPVIEKRLRIARDEIRYYKEYDYLIVNDDLEQSVLELQSIILAARCRSSRRLSSVSAIVEAFEESEKRSEAR